MINYQKQINIYKSLKYSDKKVEAGEDGYIKIIQNNKEIILEPVTDSKGFLANVEDVDEFVNGDIIVATTDGDFTIFIFDKESNTYSPKKLNIKISDDCIYNINTKESQNSRSFICSGEKNIEYEFEI